MHRTAALARHNLVLVAREPGPMISRIVMPILTVLVLKPLYTAALGPAGTTQAVAGTLVLFSLLGMSVVGNSVLVERLGHTFDRLRATPLRPVELIAGKAAPILALVVLQQAVILGTGIVALHLRVASPGLLAVAVLSWAVLLLCCGTAVGVLVRSHAALTAATDIGSLALTTFAGALVPLAAMPAWARAVAPLSPGYWAMRSLRGALAGDPATTWRSAGVLLASALVAAAVAAARIARVSGA